MSEADIKGSSQGMPDRSKASEDEVLEELRHLIVGPAQAKIEEIRERLADPREQAKAVGEILPQAITYRSAQDGQLAIALRPTVEEVVRLSIKKDPKAFAETFFPVIIPAIRKAIAEALRGMVESLNQILENSFSWQGVKWRLEAFRSGKPFSEIVLLHSIVFRVEQVFLIHRETGLLLQHVNAPQAASADADMVSAMLKAIQDFIADSFQLENHDSLEAIRVGELTIWIEQGPKAILAGVIRGNAPEDLRGLFQETLAHIHIEHHDLLESFKGNVSAFEAVRPDLEVCLRTQYHQRTKAISTGLLALSLTFVVLLVAWFGALVHDQIRWREFLLKLKASPGIVVTQTTTQKGKHLVVGLRDELAENPNQLLKKMKIDPVKVVFHWVPFQSFEDAFILKRAMRMLGPPESIELSVANGVLIAEGSAPHDWVVDARRIARSIPGAKEYQDGRVTDLDINQFEAFDNYLSLLKAQPGIMVTSAERRDGKFYISGMRDPLAKDPEKILDETNLSTKCIVFRWESYLALAPELLVERAKQILRAPTTVSLTLDKDTLIAAGVAPYPWIVEARKLAQMVPGVVGWEDGGLVDAELELRNKTAAIERQNIFFVLRTSALTSAELERLNASAESISGLHALTKSLNCNLHIEVIGHTDSSGTTAENRELSESRARLVLTSLIALGAPAQILSAKGVGAAQPYRVEKTERDRELNRRVSFHVNLGKCPP